ncbi:hypothetical protein KIM67_14635 [Flagellimonas sp. 389]|uniref:hypothetical protein n=1 Tax=Flagellimonas sp. 389 TaxID=2835862 RepID=UPI001BD2EDE8|nr:hypothetical protein [Flagellimonas sp. 389]MBS9463653.1 hypothetical protein [Flagellimonas sp. 389]
MGGEFGNIASLGALLIWIYKGFKVPYRKIRTEGKYCFEVGFGFIILVTFLVFYLPDLIGDIWE